MAISTVETTSMENALEKENISTPMEIDTKVPSSAIRNMELEDLLPKTKASIMVSMFLFRPMGKWN